MNFSVLVADARWEDALGGAEAFCARVLEAVGAVERAEGAVSILLADDAALRDLNRTHRGKDAPTNVLSFPAGPGAGGLAGDIALAFDTIAREAAAQGKTLPAHAAHMLAHGRLHLMGHDHATDCEAEIMEEKERAILATLGIGDPYEPTGITPHG